MEGGGKEQSRESSYLKQSADQGHVWTHVGLSRTPVRVCLVTWSVCGKDPDARLDPSSHHRVPMPLSSTVQLQGPAAPGTKLKRAMIMRLSQDSFNEITAALQARSKKPAIEVEFGDQSVCAQTATPRLLHHSTSSSLRPCILVAARLSSPTSPRPCSRSTDNNEFQPPLRRIRLSYMGLSLLA